MATELLINARSYETRVALIENNILAEFHLERPRRHSLAGNIYKGLVVQVLPGMQAAFVEIGLERAGFLYVSDVTDHFEEFEVLMKQEEEEDRQKFVLLRNADLKSSRRRAGNDSPQSYLYHSLAPGMRHKSMEPFLVEFEAGDWNDSLLYKHDGEEFIYLLAGELEFHYGQEIMTLKAGDSIYYDSSESHGYISLGSEKAKAVAVLYPK